MKDFAVPLPLLVIAQMMGMPNQDRPFIRSLAEKLLFLGRGEFDRMQPLSEGIKGLLEYLAPIVEERVSHPGEDLLSVLAGGERSGVYTREEVLANAILLLLAGHALPALLLAAAASGVRIAKAAHLSVVSQFEFCRNRSESESEVQSEKLI